MMRSGRRVRTACIRCVRRVPVSTHVHTHVGIRLQAFFHIYVSIHVCVIWCHMAYAACAYQAQSIEGCDTSNRSRIYTSMSPKHAMIYTTRSAHVSLKNKHETKTHTNLYYSLRDVTFCLCIGTARLRTLFTVRRIFLFIYIKHSVPAAPRRIKPLRINTYCIYGYVKHAAYKHA